MSPRRLSRCPQHLPGASLHPWVPPPPRCLQQLTQLCPGSPAPGPLSERQRCTVTPPLPRGALGPRWKPGQLSPKGEPGRAAGQSSLHTLPPPKVESQEESKQSRILSSLPPGRSVQFPSRGMCCEMWGRLARGAHAKPSGCSGAHQALVSRAPSLPRGSRGEIGTEQGTCTWSCYPEGHQDLLSRGFCNAADPGEQGAVVFWPVLLPYIHLWPILGDTETFLPHGH